MKTLSFYFAAFISLNIVFGQVKTNFNNLEEISEKGKFQKNFLAKIHRTFLQKDIQLLLDKEAKENKSGEARPFRIAEPDSVDIDVIREADWIEEGSYLYGKFTLVATGAKSISANFDQFYLPRGSELWVYSKNGEMITGPITESENNTNNFWGTWVYKGSKLTFDFRIPIYTKKEIKLHISNIAYGYKDLYVTNFGQASGCNINVLCPAGAGWENERNSVSLILNANSAALCSGALINNTCNLNIPYLLTANHCFTTTPQDVSKWKFTFQAWSPVCDNQNEQDAVGVTFNGSTLRANNAGSDFCLVELNQTPLANSGITYSGWSRANAASSSGVSITHPQGDVMKIATYNQTITQQTFLGSNDWNVVWARGTVEHGSSGGPLYNNNHQIIGQVHGGDPSDVCLPNDNAFFGRFDLSWTGGGTSATRLSDWLDPFNTGAMATNTINVASTVPNYIDASVTNPSLVCTAGNAFTLNNVPAGLTVSWQATPASLLATSSGSFISSGGSQNITLTAASSTSSGAGTLAVSVIGGCGTLNIPPLNFWVGKPVISGPTKSGPCEDPVYTYGASYYPNILYSWSIDNPNLFLSDGGITSQVENSNGNVGGNPFHITLYESSGNCNVFITQLQNFIIKTSAQCGGQQMIVTAYPNPASTTMIVQVTDSVSTSNQSSTLAQSYELTLIDRYYRKILSIRSDEKNLEIPVGNLPSGLYYLNVLYNGTVFQKQIVIKR
ncbi:MAG: trypsin-like peptidase domain-containing protein [Bacteroidetes bacterium]|nr:trypsin-like peptidase domain-containing protein [Bacteroidota bacterium]